MSSTRLFQQGPHHLRAEFVRNVSVRQQTGGELGLVLLHPLDELFDGILAEEFEDEVRLFLADAVGSVGGLGFLSAYMRSGSSFS